MIINFYILRRERRNKINKTLSTIIGQDIHIVVDGNLRDSINVSDIDIVIDISETSNIDAVAPNEESKKRLIQTFRNNPYGFNYVYIPDLKRYYFVKSINLLRKNILSFSLHVDVLMYTTFITNQTGFVARNENEYNIELPDERRIVKNEVSTDIIEVIDVTSEYTEKKLEFITDFKREGGGPVAEYFYNIIAVVHNTDVTRQFIVDSCENFTPSNALKEQVGTNRLPLVRTGSISLRNGMNFILNVYEAGQLLDSIVNGDSTLASSVGSIFAYPIDFKASYRDLPNEWHRMEKPFKIRDVSILDSVTHPVHMYVGGGLMDSYLYRVFEIPDVVDDFNDLNPYATYELNIPYYGYYKLDYNAVRGHRLAIYYIINYTDGSATVQIYDITVDSLIISLQTQLGYEIPKNMSNITDVRNRHDANNTSFGFSLLGSALAILGGIVTSNPVAVAGGVIGAGKSTGDYVKNEKTNIFTTAVNFNGSSSPVYSPQTLFIRRTKHLIQYQINADFLSESGGVLNQLRKLNTLTGYTEIADIPNILYPVSGDIPTDKEIEEIISILKSGVIF